MRRASIQRWIIVAGALVLGGGLGVLLAPSQTKTATTTELAQAHTTTTVRTVVHTVTHTTTKAASPTSSNRPGGSGTAASGGAGVTGGVPAGHSPVARGASSNTGNQHPQHFAGTGNKVLGTITLSAQSTSVRWSNSSGRFRLIYDGNGVAIDSSARTGSLVAPPMVYHQVTVDSPGHWSLQLG